jgi:alpha-ribazole phosphatase
MKLILLRHTRLEISSSDYCYGQSDIGLHPDTSFRELIGVKKKLLSEIHDKSTVVYSSPLNRCTQIANALSSEVIVDRRLIELDFGSWEMQLWSAIPEDELNTWMSDFVNIQVGGGESYKMLWERTNSWLADITELYNEQDKTIVTVTHGGVIRSLLINTLGIPASTTAQIDVEYGSLTTLYQKYGKWHLASLNT